MRRAVERDVKGSKSIIGMFRWNMHGGRYMMSSLARSSKLDNRAYKQSDECSMRACLQQQYEGADF